MPIAEITIFEGRSDDEKRLIFREVTGALERSMGASPEAIRVILREIPRMHFASAGESNADRLAREADEASG